MKSYTYWWSKFCLLK